jgi:glycine/D-amino acid oxidase-like deaminating enzyme
MPLNTPVWDDTPWTALAPLGGDVQTDVCVIGLGGSGLSSIEELVALGRRVVGIDAGSVAGGAAGRNGGFLRPGVAAPHHEAVRALGRDRAVRLHQLTLEEIGRVAGEPAARVRKVGLLRLAVSDDDRDDCERQAAAMHADGLRADPYSGPLGDGIFLPNAAAFQPLARCRALAASAVRAGALLFEETRALSFSATEVLTPRGRVRCHAVVVAVDGHLDRLCPELEGRVRTARLQMLATAPEAAGTLPSLVSMNHGFDYAQQLPGGAIALGGGRDRHIQAEWTHDGEPTEGVQRHLDRLLRERLGVRAPVTHRWAASVSYSASGLPVMEEIRPGVWAVGGYSGTGNLLGALLGRAAARAACGERCEIASLLT